MKRILLIILLYFGVFPYFKDSTLQILGVQKSYSQTQTVAQKLVAYYQYMNPDYRVVDLQYDCQCAVLVRDIATGDYFPVFGTPEWIGNNYGFQEYLVEHVNDPLPEPQLSNDPVEDEYLESLMDFLEDFQDFQDRAAAIADAMDDFWENMGSASEMGNPEAPVECLYGEAMYYGETEKVVVYNNSVLASSLPCANSFLLVTKRIIHFTPAQQARIARYNFNGSTLVSIVDNSGVTYTNSLEAEVGEADYKCSPDGIQHYSPMYVKRTYNSYRFIAFDRLRANPTLAEYYNAQLKVWFGVPYSNMDYCIEVPELNTEDAQVGSVVIGSTANGVLYCETLTAEDVARTTIADRNSKFKLKSLRLHHYVNLPKWVEDFFRKLDLYPGDCAIDYVNERLDELHADPVYINETNEDVKKKMEFENVAYDLLFGMLYCATNEAAAQGEAAPLQFGMGMLHEAISSVDVKQIVTGVAQMAKGLANAVAQNVKNVITAAKDIVIQQTTGTVDYEQIAKKFIEANFAQLADFYNTAKTIATHFKETYFTKCDTDPLYGDICSYRHGEVAMMVLPIVITGGEWLVVKAEALVTKYALKTERAITLMKEAANASRQTVQGVYTVLDDAGTTATTLEKTIIKESDGVTVHSTIKNEGEVGDELLVITEAAHYVDHNIVSTLAVNPTPLSASNYVPKNSFRDYALKIDPQVDPNLKAAVDDIIANGDLGGTKTETLIQDYLFETKMGLTKLDGKVGSNNGFDGVFVKYDASNNPEKIFICESKQQWSAGVQLNPADVNTGLPAQMTNAWIQDVTGRLRNAGKTAIADLIDYNMNIVHKTVVTVNKSTGDINILKL